jgi:hypothetical protein
MYACGVEVPTCKKSAKVCIWGAAMPRKDRSKVQKGVSGGLLGMELYGWESFSW